jgi:hypothetical protein
MMDMSPETQAGIDAHRARYEALKAAGTEVAAALPLTALDGAPVDPARVLHRETVPGGWYAAATLRRGNRLRLVNIGSAGTAALLAWALHDPSERLNHADTLKIQWTAALRRGHVLFSDTGRAMLSITEDSSGAHDALIGGSTAASAGGRPSGLSRVSTTKERAGAGDLRRRARLLGHETQGAASEVIGGEGVLSRARHAELGKRRRLRPCA